MEHQLEINKPMPLKEFLAVMAKLVKVGQWDKYRLAVKKRKDWFAKYQPDKF